MDAIAAGVVVWTILVCIGRATLVYIVAAVVGATRVEITIVERMI